MQPWIRQVLREARELAGATLRDVEAASGVDRSNLSRYERGEAAWPTHMDGIVAAYAQVAGVEPVELWARAVALWQQDGSRGTAAAASRARREVRRQRQRRSS